MNKDPKISIITVCKNSSSTIENTIKSIIKQNYNNIEFIIIDGKSNDTTLSIIEKYKKNISKLISEEDHGIYDAFNKGLKLATGDLIGFVNSDDTLTDNATEILLNYYKKNPEVDFIFGSVKKHWGILHGYNPWKIFFSWGFYTSHSTGFFIKKDAAEKVGNYNTKYKYSADYDYFYRMIVGHKLKGVATKKNEVLGIFARGGYSSRVNFFDHLCECTKIRIDNGQNKLIVLFTFLLKYLYNINKIR
ncbi:glycosyltransferase [Candidatus Pelagibacter sp.]|jgi:glycosyltransferase involved in cell wall biosynthesis|nr:glycosyltransferase [Candidatus Pelagibacter sp.]